MHLRQEASDFATDVDTDAAKRNVVLDDDRTVWTLEGDRHLIEVEPVPDRRLTVRGSHRPPASKLATPLFAPVWINRARRPLHAQVAAHPDDPNTFALQTYPQVTTSFKFTDSQRWEDCARRLVRRSSILRPAPGCLRGERRTAVHPACTGCGPCPRRRRMDRLGTARR